ncbi:hypothetical protein [Endozoicomonas sp. ONNA2]|uniref:hypothetical protein n=1 Tax=Endozoicomonas sp. ONNA2 TaxID=2828741 RepID=UPI00214871CA|nr:hypothetical protein [Endozoicomonas sp. ONNA2]
MRLKISDSGLRGSKVIPCGHGSGVISGIQVQTINESASKIRRLAVSEECRQQALLQPDAEGTVVYLIAGAD